MVGGDGAIYAIRRALWQTLPDDAINDFLNPLQIVAAGWRAVYEPEAFCYEETAGDTRREYRRRVRIVSRSWRAVFQAGPVLNPARMGFFSVAVWSHKVLRWMTGLFLVTAAVSALIIGWYFAEAVRVGVMAGAAALAILLIIWPSSRRPLGMGFYYLVVSLASIVGLAKGSTGRVSGVWTTPRGATSEPGGFFADRTGAIILALVGAATIAGFVLLGVGTRTGARVVFYTASATLIYVYIGYPVVLAALRPIFRRPISKGEAAPSVCLFIAANDEAGVIEAKLRNALSMDYPASRLSVVVASDGSVDGTNEIVASFAHDGVRLIAFPERRGKIAAINDGIREVKSDVVVFSDANTFLDPGAMRALVRNFADDSVGAVSGDVILRGERAALARSEDLYYRYERWLQQNESDIGSMLGVDGALYAIRRDLFVPPPSDTILDDMAIPMSVVRAGKRVVFEPEAIAHEHGSESATEEFSRKTRVVAGAVQFLLRKDSGVPVTNLQLLGALVSHKTLRWLSPVFGLMAFTAAIVLAAHSPAFLWLTLAGAVFVLAGLIGCVPAIRRISVIGLAHYFWLVQTAAFVGVARGLFGRQAVAWRRFARGTPVGLSGV